MGGGLAQVGLLLVAIVIGLPCFFFTLLALLDHFERRLTAEPPAVAGTAVRPAQVVQTVQAPQLVVTERVAAGAAEPDHETDSELIGAVLELPPPFSAPAAAAG